MDGKARKILIYGGLSFLLIVIAFLVFLGPKFGISSPLAVGFSTISLSQISTTSNDPNLAGQIWVMAVSQNGAGQSAYFTTQTLTSSNGQSSNPFTLKISLNKNYATYPIRNQGIPIYSVSYTTTKDNPLSSSYGCNPSYWDFAVLQKPAIPYITTVYCYSESLVGYYGTLGAGTNNFQSTISVSGTGGSDSCTISNSQATSCYSSAGNVYASWVGSLSSGTQLPSPSGQGIIAVYDTSTGGWKTASQTQYNQWLNYYQNGLSNCLSQQSATGTGGSTCFSTYNQYEQGLMSGAQFTSSGGYSATTTGGQSNGEVNLNLGQQLQFPLITLKVKASLIGINIPLGKPQITYASSPQFQTGQQGNIMVTVKNVGQATGSFNVYATCTGSFQQTGGSQTVSSLSAGNSQNINIPITSNVVSGTGAGTCTVTANDINDPTQKSTYTVSVSSSALTVCSQGQEKFVGQKIQECQNNAWVTIKTCSSSQHPDYVSGKIQCVANTTTATGGFLSSIGNFLNNSFSGITNFFTILKWIAIIIGGLFALIFSKEILSRILRTIGQGAIWVISGITAVLVGILVYELWWIAVIVFIGYIIFKIAVPK